MKLLTALFLAIAALIGFSAETPEVSATEPVALAKCAMPSFEASYRDSKAIFVGKVISERKEGDEKIFTFQVEKYWKGSKSRTVEVKYYENMRYQAWLKVGGKYLIYARGNDDGTLSDGRCSLTKNYSATLPELKKLGKAKIVK